MNKAKPSGKTSVQKKRKSTQTKSATPYTALILDADFQVRTYGEAATEMFGFEQAHIVGRHVSQILPALGEHLGKAQSEGQEIRFTGLHMDAVRDDGKTFPVVVGIREDSQYAGHRHVVLVRNLESIVDLAGEQ